MCIECAEHSPEFSDSDKELWETIRFYEHLMWLKRHEEKKRDAPKYIFLPFIRQKSGASFDDIVGCQNMQGG